MQATRYFNGFETIANSTTSEGIMYMERLIRDVKKEVKQIMEEAVTKKFIHEDSGSITSLCAAVELCVLNGLKRRALGLFKSNSTTALLHKVAKSFQPAASIAQMVVEMEACESNKRSSSGNESSNKLVKPLLKKNNSTASTKYLWIRLALIEKQLAKIIHYIVENSSKYYERDALLADANYGSILSSLLVGPCALDFSKLRIGEHLLWSDPPADELVQRNRIQTTASPPVSKRPALHYKGVTGSTGNSDDSHRSKEYVESLHQNSKSTLLYGKNNVLVIPKDVKQRVAGYLSLHQYGETLSLKWTPNRLMDASTGSSCQISVYWEHATNVFLHEVVYVHCHQDLESDWIVLVGQDGVQRSPMHFPRGGHLLAFLSCLENGLLPHGRLDPPLWAQRGNDCFPMIGKVFPKVRRKGSRKYARSEAEPINGPGEGEENGTSDFVFRIVYNYTRSYIQMEEMMEDNLNKYTVASKGGVFIPSARTTPLHSISSISSSSTSSSKSIEQQPSAVITEIGEPIQVVCESMKKRIISRAFYGWLSHCRHLRTVRTHLIGLVRENSAADYPDDASGGLTVEKWEELREKGELDMQELYRYVYFGGVAHSLRSTLWPIILRGSVVEGEDKCSIRKEYAAKMSEWLAVEAIVKQRDQEILVANLARNSGKQSVPAYQSQSSMKAFGAPGSNEVFEDGCGSYPAGAEKRAASTSGQLEREFDISVELEGSCDRSKPLLNTISGNSLSIRGSGSLSTTNSRSFPEIPAKIGECNPDISRSDSQIYTQEQGCSKQLLQAFALNLHRIDKDVKRCDRNYWYFTEENLEKLRNVICTYVWDHIEVGYVQGMCDLAAPLLVILDDEAEAYECFLNLMQRMSANFPCGGAMDAKFANMRSLLQVLDHDLFTLIRQNGDYTHFYFCYRWFLLDFKREFCYNDMFLVWETIWAAQHIASNDFELFLALALLNYYRDIILSNSMDFTDIIKFFNEMAERHDAKIILKIARKFVLELQTLIEDK